jgi:O-antigen ligase
MKPTLMSPHPGVLRQIYLRLGPGLCFLAVLLAVIAPKAVAWIFPLFGAVVLFAHPSDRGSRTGSPPASSVLIWCCLFAAYVLLSALWSGDSLATLTSGSVFTAYLIAAWLAQKGLNAETSGMIERLAHATVAAMVIGAAFLVFELATGSLIERTLFTYLSAARPLSPKHVGMQNGYVVALVPDELNRSVGVLNLILWPTLLIVATSKLWPRAPLIFIGVATLAVTATFFSQHETSKVAIVCAAIVVLLHYARPGWALVLTKAGWLVALILVVPAAQLAYVSHLHTAEWLPVNARARIIIWAATAEQVGQRPIFGIGANSTKSLNEMRPSETRADHVVPWRTAMHAHNVYLQTWYELGAVGVVLLGAAGLSILSMIGLMAGLPQAFALAAFVSAAVMGAFSWGMWQPWFVASYLLASTIVTLALKHVAWQSRCE